MSSVMIIGCDGKHGVWLYAPNRNGVQQTMFLTFLELHQLYKEMREKLPALLEQGRAKVAEREKLLAEDAMVIDDLISQFRAAPELTPVVQPTVIQSTKPITVVE